MIILTDLSEVLIRGITGTEKIVRDRYGKRVAKEYVQRRTGINPIFCELMRGHISEDVYWYVFLQNKSWPFNSSELKELLSLNMMKKIPGTLDVYQRIISYPDSTEMMATQIDGRPDFWLASDHIFEREVELEYLHPDVFKLVSNQLWSFDYSILKSDTGFFRRVLSRYDLLPEEVVFIDDYQPNIVADAAEGITTIKFKDAEQLETELCRLGFLFADTVQEANEINGF